MSSNLKSLSASFEGGPDPNDSDSIRILRSSQAPTSSLSLPGDRWLQGVLLGRVGGQWESAKSPSHTHRSPSASPAQTSPGRSTGNKSSLPRRSPKVSPTMPTSPLRPVTGRPRERLPPPDAARPRTAPEGNKQVMRLGGEDGDVLTSLPSPDRPRSSLGGTRSGFGGGLMKVHVEEDVGERVSSPSRTRNHRKVRLGVSIFDASNEHTSPSAKIEQPSFFNPTISAMRDLALGLGEGKGSGLGIPVERMDDKDASAWVERWIDSFNVEASQFKSPLSFAESKISEMSSQTGLGSSGVEPNAFRTAVCCELLDRICPELGPYQHIVGKIKKELLRSIYAGVKEEECANPEPLFHFSKSPFFFDNLSQQKTIENLQNELKVLDAKCARTQADHDAMKEETEALDARIVGLKLRVHSAEQELLVFKEATAKKEQQLLNELQVLRDKIIQVSVTAQNPEGGGEGGGLSGDKELLEIFKREIDRNQDHELTNSQFKVALGYTTTLMRTVCQGVDEHVAAYEAEAKYWEGLVKSRQNILLLHDRGPRGLEELTAQELMMRWVKYHIKVAHQENPTGQFSDPGQSFKEGFVDALKNGDVMIDAFSQVCPLEMRLEAGEVLEAKSIGLGSVFDLVTKLAHNITQDDTWRTCDLSMKHQELLLDAVGAAMLSRPALDNEVFGFAKHLQTKAYNLSEEVDKLRQNQAEFMRKVDEAAGKGEMMDAAAVEMAIASVNRVKALLSEGWAHLRQVQEEMERVERIWIGVVSKVRTMLIDNSIQKTRKAESNERRAYMQGKEDGLAQTSEFDEDKVMLLAPMVATQQIEVAPGDLAKAKPKLPPAAKAYLSNLTLDKLSDMTSNDQHEYFVESLEKCAEFTVNYYDVLRKCFRHYCKINHTGTNVVMGGACMSYTAWESLLTDIRVLGYDSKKKLSAKRCEDIFKKSNMCVDAASGRLLAGNRDMEAPEFIEALIRVAADVGTKNAMELPFSYLQTVKMITQYAKKEKTEAFRRACREANVQDVLSKNEASLKEIYTHYAKLDNSAGDDNMDEMNLQEFILFAKDAGILDANLTQTCIVNIFIYVQDEDPDTHHVQDKVSEEGDEIETDRQLDFAEFCEALCGCSCYKILDPYFTLNQKLDHLCSRYIVPFATRVKRNTVRNGVADSLVQIAKGMN